MKKILIIEFLMVLLLAGLMTLFLYKKGTKDVPLAEIENAFTSTCDLTGMEKAGDMRMKRAFGLNASDFSEFVYYTPDNTMGVYEFLVIKMKDVSQKETILSGINTRLATQKKSFDGYGTNQTDLLNHAVIYEAGNYVGFFVSENADSWRSLVKEKVEE